MLCTKAEICLTLCLLPQLFCMLQVLLRADTLAYKMFFVTSRRTFLKCPELTDGLLKFFLYWINSGLSLREEAAGFTSAVRLMHLLIDHLLRETSFETEEVSLFFFTVSPKASDFIAPKAACLSLFLSCFRTFIAPLKSVAIALNASTSFSSLGDVTNLFSCSAFLVWGLHTRFNIIRFQPFSLAFWVEHFWFCPQLSFLPYRFGMRKDWKNFWAFFPGMFSKKLFSLEVLLIFEPAIHLVCSINLNK